MLPCEPSSPTTPSLLAHLAHVPDTREDRTKRHPASVEWNPSVRCSRVPTQEVPYFISSLPAEVEPWTHAVRSQWAIENRCHWVLDVLFHKDSSRVRKDHGPANLATLRRWVLNLLR
jgi:predicted transposase YbfD/YdcC